MNPAASRCLLIRPRFYWKNPSAHTPPSMQPNATTIAIRTLMRRVPVGKSRLYSRCRRSVFDRYQPIGEICASFGKREFTSSTISTLASAPNNPQAAVPTTAAMPTITRGFMVEIVTGHSGHGGPECRLAIALATFRLYCGHLASFERAITAVTSSGERAVCVQSLCQM
jgi:hypothetical protein